MARRLVVIVVVLCGMSGLAAGLAADEPTVDLTAYNPKSATRVRHQGNEILATWPADHKTGYLVLELRTGQPLIQGMGFAGELGDPDTFLLENADPITFLLVGTRQAPPNRPPGMSVFNTFFDSPATRPFQTYRSHRNLKRVRVLSHGQRTVFSIGDVTMGPFSGELRLTLYSGTSLIHIETVVHTQEDRRAILYDTGLALEPATKARFAWVDTEGK